MSGSSLRGIALIVHRYVGLVLSVFLILAGTTGSIIAFYADLDAALNPHLFRVAPPRPGAPMLDPLVLRERVLAQLPRGTTLDGAVLHLKHGETVNYWANEREVFADPYTGLIKGSRRWGELGEGSETILTFIYRLHFSLALGEVGTLIFGCVALLWMFDCVVGAYLTFPPATRRKEAGGPSWARRWLASWSLNTAKLFSFNFSWHRASGLWIWAMLLVFAWSSVALNLSQVYEPVMSAFFGAPPDDLERIPELPRPRTRPALSFVQAREIGARLMAEEARRRHFRVIAPHAIYYEAEKGTYYYTVESTRDMSERLSDTYVVFDGDNGRRLAFGANTGEHAGATVTSVLIALHFGAIREGGYAYRAFVCLMGIAVVLLSVSGVWIWWKKRRGRVAVRKRAPKTPPVEPAKLS